MTAPRKRTEYTHYKSSDVHYWTVDKLFAALSEAKRLDPDCGSYEVVLLGGLCPDVVVVDDYVKLGRL